MRVAGHTRDVTALARQLTPVPAKVIYLSAVKNVRRRQKLIPMSHTSERAWVFGLAMGLSCWAGVALIALGVWALFF